MNELDFRRFNSRKFAAFAFVAVAAVVLRVAEYLDAAQVVDLLKWSTGLYMAGNVGDTWAEKK